MDEIKKALHQEIDELKIPELEISQIRLTVVLKKPKPEQSKAKKPKK